MKKAQKVRKAQNPVKRTRKRKHEKSINGEVYFDTCKAAEILGVSRGSIFMWARNKMLRCLRLGRCAYFKQQWLDDFVHERTQEVI